MRLVALLPLLGLTHACACEQGPCDNDYRLVDAFIYVVDGEIELSSPSGWGGYGPHGTLDDSAVSECVGSTYSVDITGEVSSLAVFDLFESIGGQLSISVESGIEDVDGFEALTSVGALSLGGMQRVSGLNGVQATGALGLSARETVTGLRALQTVAGPVYLSQVGAVPGLTALRTAGSIESFGGTITDLSPLISLVEVTGDVILRQTPIQILGMGALQEIGGNLKIQLAGFPLTAWNGFASMARIGGELLVRGNNSLPSEQVHEWLIDVDVAGTSTVCENLGGAADICPPIEAAEE